jgi:hypothetical protein
VIILFPSNEEEIDEGTEFSVSPQMSMFAKLTETHPGEVFPEDPETILSRFAQREGHNLLSQSQLDPDTRDCDD